MGPTSSGLVILHFHHFFVGIVFFARGQICVCYSRATLIGTPCVLPLEGPIIWKVPLTEKALATYVCVPAKTSVRPKPGPAIWKVPPKNVEQDIYEYVDRKNKDTFFTTNLL